MKPYLYILVFCLLSSNCRRNETDKRSTSKSTYAQSDQGSYGITHDGRPLPEWKTDILARLYDPTEGKPINPESVATPKVMPLKSRPKVVPARTNVHPIGTPIVEQAPEILKVITPGKDGVPLPTTIPVKGKSVLAIQPIPRPSLPFRMKDAALFDIQYLSVDQGMSSPYVNSIEEDSRGNLWFGTEAGVNRYDGVSFTHFNTEHGLSHNFVLSIKEDSHGNLWFGTKDGGVSRFNGTEFTHFTTEYGFGSNRVWSIEEDNRGNLWFGTSLGVIRYDPNANNGQGSFTHFTTQHGLSNNFVRSIEEDRQGNLWIGTLNGVTRYNPNANNGQGQFTQITFKHGWHRNYVWSIKEDSREHLWFGTRDGVTRYDPNANNGRGQIDHFTIEHGLSHNSIRSIEEDSRGNVWFGTEGGGVNYHNGTNFIHFSTEHGLSDNSVHSIIEDSRGNIWFGTEAGVSRYNGAGFIHFTAEGGINNKMVWSIEEDSQGNLWFGTDKGGVIRYTPDVNKGQGSFTHFTTEQGLSSNSIRAIEQDSRGNIWFGTLGGGVSRFNPDANNGQGQFTHFTTKQGMSDNSVYCILEDSRKNLWFGTIRGGVSRFNPDANNGLGQFTHFLLDHGLRSSFVRSIEEDSRGNIWFGMEGSGVSCYNAYANIGQRQFTHFITEPELSDNAIYSILEDSRGNVWFGTENGGVVRYKPNANYDYGEITTYATEHGLSHNSIRSIEEDKQKNIWVSTKNGITLLTPYSDKSPLTPVFRLDDYQFFNFGKEDGIKKMDFSTTSYLDRNNCIWWGTQDGLTMLNLNQFKIDKEPPSIGLEHVEINDNFLDFHRLGDSTYRASLSFGEDLSHSFDSVVPFYNYPLNLTLPYRLNHLTFYFSAIDWAAPHKIRYSYKLDDDNWSAPKSENKAVYRNISYGKHTFKVKAVGVAQVESKPFEYTFNIRPPWWLTWWALTYYGLLIGGFFYALYYFLLNRRLQLAETRRLRELNSLKTKLYANITHEFRTPLTVIQGLTDQIENRAAKKKDPVLQSNARIVKRNSSHLFTLVTKMLDLHKLESGNLPVHLIQGDIVIYLKYLLESFHSLAESKDISLHFLAKEKEVIMDYDPEKILHIVTNLLSNAIKFTPDGGDVYVVVSIRQSAVDSQQLIGGSQATGKKSILISVKDTGTGIPADKLPHIFDRFYQVNDELTRQVEGTGIGLTLTHELVKLLGGEVTVESESGTGTTFIVKLPIHHTASLIEGAPDVYRPEAAITLAGPVANQWTVPGGVVASELSLVLIIEDNPDVANYIRSCLQGHYRIETVHNGREGIDRAVELVPDLIISDVIMPEKDGFEVTHTLKNDPHTSHIPIILLTAKADTQSKLEGLERGADAYLPKPFHPEELLIRSRKLLELRQKLQARYRAMAAGTLPAPEPSEAAPPKQEDAFVLQVRELVEGHLTDYDFSVEQLAFEIHMSRSQLHRKLSALTGYSAIRFIRYIRLNKAKELLQDPELPIGNVAYDSGFSDPAYFTRVFRQEFGMSPTEFREDG